MKRALPVIAICVAAVFALSSCEFFATSIRGQDSHGSFIDGDYTTTVNGETVTILVRCSSESSNSLPCMNTFFKVADLYTDKNGNKDIRLDYIGYDTLEDSNGKKTLMPKYSATFYEANGSTKAEGNATIRTRIGNGNSKKMNPGYYAITLKLSSMMHFEVVNKVGEPPELDIFDNPWTYKGTT